MPGIQLGFKLDDAQVKRLVERAPAAVLNHMRRLIEGAAIDVQREMRIQAPIAVTGQLRGSVRYKFNAMALRAEISPNVPYGSAIEEGRGPRKVSVAEGSPLRKWAEFKGLNPYAVQKSIAKKGTKANPFIQRTYNRMKPIVEKDIEEGMVALIRSLDNGGV
jgi:hypothetical protein